MGLHRSFDTAGDINSREAWQLSGGTLAGYVYEIAISRTLNITMPVEVNSVPIELRVIATDPYP